MESVKISFPICGINVLGIHISDMWTNEQKSLNSLLSGRWTSIFHCNSLIAAWHRVWFTFIFFPLIISIIIVTISIYLSYRSVSPRRHSISFQTRQRLNVWAYFVLRKIFPLIGNLIYIQSNQFKLYALVFVFPFSALFEPTSRKR